MKKIITLFIALFITVSSFGQAPDKMSYQGVIRNSSNALVINQTVGMQISILQGGDLANPGTTISYVETQTPTTNANGLVSLEIGAGTAVTGSFAGINWANGPYFIKTETDPSGGTSYSITGTTELMSVPYALYAANGISSVQASDITTNNAKIGFTDALVSANATVVANTAKVGQTPGATAGDMQYWDGTAWVIVPTTAKQGVSLQLIGGIPSWVSGPLISAPGAVIIGTATAADAQATVSFTAPSNDGGSPITNYTATSSPGNIIRTLTQSGSGTILVPGLTNGTAYTFTVTATNAVGESAASDASNSVTPIVPQVPNAPIIGIATAGNTQATVSFTAPSNDGGSAITSYTATSSPDNIIGILTQSGSGTILVPGLTNGTAYTFTVTATNAVGASAASAASNSVTALSSVTIGTQVWQSRNLDVATYRDGTVIPQVTDQGEWEALTTAAWCYYNNDPANGTTYGKYYNWYAVMGITVAEDATPTDAQIAARKQLAPIGWHVPSVAEWTTLTTFLGGENVAGGKMKEVGIIPDGTWKSPNTDATNSSGFTALAGGYRMSFDNNAFGFSGGLGFHWSSTSRDAGFAFYQYLFSYDGKVVINSGRKGDGITVRTLRD
jgi:uncharacterized protein (TIGR02145 family)